MSLAPITLPTDKSTAVIDNAHRSLRQDESGLSITVTVLNADNTAYNLTGKNLVFCENKQNNKIIIDNGHGDNCGTFIRNSDNDAQGIFTYVLQENVYAASGRAWFEITDGNTVDSTKNFYFDVETDAPISVTDNDYIGSLKALETAMAGAQDKVTSDLADMENQINQYIANTNTASAAQITQAVKNLTDQTTAALSNVDQYTQKLATLQSQWDSELQNIQTKATNDTDSAVQAINDKYTNDFAQLKSDFTNWQTSTTQNYQKQVDDILAKVQADDTEVAGVQKQVDDTIAKMQTLSQQFSKIDFTQFLKPSALDNYYTKAELDPKLADAGKLKTINGKAPDSNGDIQVPAYAPNLLLGTSHTPIIKSITGWGDGFQYYISEKIPKGTKITIRAYFNNPTNQLMNMNGIFNSHWLRDDTVSQVYVPPHSTGYSYNTYILSEDIDKNDGYIYSSLQNQISDSETATISDVKLAVWPDPNTPPDMTWVPNEADKANSSDVTTLQGMVTSQGTEISQNTTAITQKANSSDVTTLQGMVTSQGTEISQNTTAITQKANSSDVYTKSEIDPMIAPVNWKTVDSVNADTITYTSKLFITNVIGAPTSDGTWGYLVTDRGHDNPHNRVTQEWWSDGGNFGQTAKHYYRQITSDDPSWSPWVAQAMQSDLTTLQGRIAALENKNTPTMVACTQAEYSALTDKDPNTIYMIGG